MAEQPSFNFALEYSACGEYTVAIPNQFRKPLMRFLWRRLLYVALATLVLAGGFIGWAYRATQHVPDFYERQLEAENPVVQRQRGDEFERQALELNNQIRKSDHWQARFSADEINAWLAVDMPEKFPEMLPDDVRSPRVAIEPDLFQLACRVENTRFSSIVSLGVQPYVTSEPNVLALRVKQLRAGALPIPLGKYLEKIALQCAKAGIPLRWTEEEGDPVALVTLPLDPEDFRNRHVKVEEIQLAEGALIVSGVSEPIAE
jgi:hypothetical protein